MWGRNDMGTKNGTLFLDPSGEVDMDYITFGKGEKNLVMIPGLGDGLKTVKGMAGTFSVLYRRFAQQYRVSVFSQRNLMEEGFAIRDMAADVYKAMQMLEIETADVIGVSQGGMIAQWLAVDYPQAVDKLVLTVTTPYAAKQTCEVVRAWIEMAENDEYSNLMIDTAEKMYSENHLKKMRHLYPVLGAVGKPHDFGRFLIMARACLTHDTRAVLDKITSPTLVIGGAQDLVIGKEAASQLAEKIPGSQLYIYEEFGHGAYEEARDYQQRVLEFLK